MKPDITEGGRKMKKFSVPLMLFVGLLMTACCHTYDLDVQGHRLTQVRTWDFIGPSTVGFYEDVDGKLHVYQDSSGNILGQVAQAAGGAYAGERIGDGLKHQEPDSTNINNDISAEATGGAGGYSEGGTAFGGVGIGGAGGAGGNAVSGSVSGAAAGAISNSSSRVTAPVVKPSIKPAVSGKPSAKPQQRQNVTVNNRLNQ